MPQLRQVELPSGPRLALRNYSPEWPPGVPQRPPFLLVHGLASNAMLWDGVGERLAADGHQVIAVDQRGHGLSSDPEHGYNTKACAADLAALMILLGWNHAESPAPIVVGQSWGGNVALCLAAKPGVRVSAVGCIDGGWIRLADRFDSFDACWSALAPPNLQELTYTELSQRIARSMTDWPPGAAQATMGNLVLLQNDGVRARLARPHHREIVRSLYENDPAEWYPRVSVPVLLAPAADPDAAPPEVIEAAAALANARVSYYRGAHHDLHLQHPDRVAADLITLANSCAIIRHPG